MINKEDVWALLTILFLSTSVLVLMLMINVAFAFPVAQYYLLPVGWFIGATMVWGWGIYQKNTLS
jgi:hypothetical protein